MCFATWENRDFWSLFRVFRSKDERYDLRRCAERLPGYKRRLESDRPLAGMFIYVSLQRKTSSKK